MDDHVVNGSMVKNRVVDDEPVANSQPSGDVQHEPYLTIVIPAYNEERRLPPALERVAEFLRGQPFRSEVLVVENGSTDATSQAVETFIAETVYARTIRSSSGCLHSEKGKGNAVRHGVLAGRGEYLLISDTDLAVPIEEAVHLLPPEQDASGYGIAIASREVPGAVRHGEPAYRHLMGRVFNLLVRWFAVAGHPRHAMRVQVFQPSCGAYGVPLAADRRLGLRCGGALYRAQTRHSHRRGSRRLVLRRRQPGAACAGHDQYGVRSDQDSAQRTGRCLRSAGRAGGGAVNRLAYRSRMRWLRRTRMA